MAKIDSKCFSLISLSLLLIIASTRTNARGDGAVSKLVRTVSLLKLNKVPATSVQVGFHSLHRTLMNNLKTSSHDVVTPPSMMFPATNPVTLPTNPVSTPTNPITTPSGNVAPSIVPVPATNPASVAPTNPATTPLPIPSTNPSVNQPAPVTNPVTPSSPVNNPVTTYPAPATNPVTVTPPATTNPIVNAPAIPVQSWCVARSGTPEAALQEALDYACGIGGADCSAIQEGQSCYMPNTLEKHASYAFNNYYQKKPVATRCDFGGTAIVISTNPSAGSCIFPSSGTSTPTSTFPTPSSTSTASPSSPTIPATPLPIPSTNPVTVPPTNPSVNQPAPITNPVTTPSPTSVPVTTPSPVNNPVTTYPPPVGNVPVSTTPTNPVTVTPPATTTPITNAPTIPGQSWCITRTGASQAALQKALDYACGLGGSDCSAIQQGQSCYIPNTLEKHASYAFNNYYQKNPAATSCDFGGTAIIVSTNPSTGSCIFPNSVTSTTNPASTTNPVTSPASSSPVTGDTTGTINPPPFVFNTSSPGSGSTTAFGYYSPPGDSNSTSQSVTLQPLTGLRILTASVVSIIVVLHM